MPHLPFNPYHLHILIQLHPKLTMTERSSIEYIINHVYMPPKLPQESDFSVENEHVLADAVATSAKHLISFLPTADKQRMQRISSMLEALRETQQYTTFPAARASELLGNLRCGDTLAYLIRAQNAGIIVRQKEEQTVFEAFEVSPSNQDVIGAVGKLICTYPGPAVAINQETTKDSSFCTELASFLSQMNVDRLDDSAAKTTKAGSTVVEERDTAHPRYITELLVGILDGHGESIPVPRIKKRIGDDVLWLDADLPWRRSPLWTVARVAIQTTLYQDSEERNHLLYKIFLAFFMTEMLKKALEFDIPDDILYCMRAKLAARVRKLDDKAPAFLIRLVAGVANDVQDVLRLRWQKVQDAQSLSPPWALDELNLDKDCRLTLPNSRQYIIDRLVPEINERPSCDFVPKDIPRIRDRDFSSPDLLAGLTSSSFIMLADFEMLVHRHLATWVIEHNHEESSITLIATHFQRYFAAAQPAYKGSPEDLSVMFLTIFLLWMALDRIAITQCPLLQEFSPELPLDYLEALLLRKHLFLDNLASITQYLTGRHSMATKSVFSDDVDRTSFAIRFFEDSSTLQSLKAKIERDAEEARAEKLRELERLDSERDRLVREENRLDHASAINRYGYEYHPQYCQKCSLERRVKEMEIGVHEWPLPTNQLQAKATVFELQPPLSFRTWREVTYEIITNVCRQSTEESVSPPVLLENYPGLDRYSSPTSRSRIGYASTTKSFLNAHYRTTMLPTTGDAICVNNGLSFRLHDPAKGQWAVPLPGDPVLVKRCTFKLPSSSPFIGLQHTLEGTMHTSNEVIALQSACPLDLNLFQFESFGTLRSGGRIQWLNILRELRTRVLPLDRDEVRLLLLQAAFQVGPSLPGQHSQLQWHVDLCCQEYAKALLEEMKCLVSDVENNWLRVGVVELIALLTSRLLASNLDPSSCIVVLGYELMRRARGIACRWMKQVIGKLKDAQREEDISEFQQRVSTAAATCRATFDVDDVHLPNLLNAEEDVAIFIECAVRVRDNKPLSLATLPAAVRSLLTRDRRLSHTVENHLFGLLNNSVHLLGLDIAITSIWPAYHRVQDWVRLAAPVSEWMGTESRPAPLDTHRGDIVHLNILNGQLLVNGLPVGRLPLEIMEHTLYKRIFGQKILDVIPTQEPGMTFGTRDEISGHQVYFSLRKDNLLIRVRRATDKQAYELIPQGRFCGSSRADLPAHLLENYVHWVALSSATEEAARIELRPLDSLWEPSSLDWLIEFSSNQSSYLRAHISRGSIYVLDNFSAAFNMLSKQFGRIEQPDNLLVTYSPMDLSQQSALTVQLVRYRLMFFVNNDGQLQSCELPNMVVDSDQSVGTLIGLKSQLVLRSVSPSDRLTCLRRIIVPVGELQLSAPDSRCLVTIRPASRKGHTCYQTYMVDDELGKLRGDSTMSNELYAVLLHAYTSHCIPDPLTGQTGTEEALHRLRSATCSSFQQLGNEEHDTLSKIASLTPSRSYYPPHLAVMQSIQWSNLPTLSQHNNFAPLVQKILDFAKSLTVFNAEPTSSAQQRRAKTFERDATTDDAHLRGRATARCNIFYPGCWSYDSGPEVVDEVYLSRHIFPLNDSALDCVREFSRHIRVHPSRLSTSRNLLAAFIGWKNLSGLDDTHLLSYSRRWLSPNLNEIWLSLYDRCRRSTLQELRFRVLFSLSAMGYANPQHREYLPTILAFCLFPAFREIAPPPGCEAYDLTAGFRPDEHHLRSIASSLRIEFNDSAAASMSRYSGETESTYRRRCSDEFSRQCQADDAQLISSILAQWPCESITVPHPKFHTVKLEEFLVSCQQKIRIWSRNRKLSLHVQQIQVVLEQIYSPIHHDLPPVLRDYSPVPVIPLHQQTPPVEISLNHLLTTRLYSTLGSFLPVLSDILGRCGTDRLQDLITEFKNSGDPFCQVYGRGLQMSRTAITRHKMSLRSENQPYKKTMTEYRHRLSSISRALAPESALEDVASAGGLWPRITVHLLLRELSPARLRDLPDEWKEPLVSLGLDLLRFQRSQRILQLQAQGSTHQRDVVSELSNDVMDKSEALQYPDRLLIQLDGNFVVRSVQKHVTDYMTNVDRSENVVLQLNMGEGKSSVIVPMVAATLADGKLLVRVVVLKPLAPQMFDLLVKRLTGLANRRIFYFPFSRGIAITQEKAQAIRSLYELCVHQGGILLAQPEHILSFKLMGIDMSLKTCSDAFDITRSLISTQRWLDECSKDILDESDEILHVKYQLVYTAGDQVSPEDHPDRWTTTQQVFELLKKHAVSVRKLHPEDIEVLHIHRDFRAGSLPIIRIVGKQGGEALITAITNDILRGYLGNLAFGQLPSDVKDALLSYIVSPEVSESHMAIIDERCRNSGHLWKGILLLRGLFAHGVLLHTLKDRRWRVNYGLHPARTMLAVPFSAKDVPSPNADFGHPDVTIVLTCMSYYYGGLSAKQLATCFEILFKLDNPAMEYQKWVSAAGGSVPENLRVIDGVNLEDSEQRKGTLIPLFSCNQAVIDFFLAQMVFPRSAKEFTHRLATSAWDLASEKTNPTVGFSGTNDNQHLLPITIQQQDPIGHAGTNALVLYYLLQPENGHYRCYHDDSGGSLGAREFLKLWIAPEQPELRVLLDIGAQMIDMSNLDLARHWLSLMPHMLAAVFFDENDGLAVVTREGNIDSLVTSSFNQRLDQCLVYLDDAHTRGTDLKLPIHYRAAVTLGPKLTKDRLLQGCMRLRQLGHGQSVMFFAPPEVDHSIRVCMSGAGKDATTPVCTQDILRWSMQETCEDIRHNLPKWSQQGLAFIARKKTWLALSSDSDQSLNDLRSCWLERDSRSLEELYGSDRSSFATSIDIDDLHPNIVQRMKLCTLSPQVTLGMDEEQERQLSHELEREPQVERPPRVKAAQHTVAQAVRQFVQTGIMVLSAAFVPITNTNIVKHSSLPWAADLIATMDFITTVDRHDSGDHLRPVHWILSSKYNRVLIILSPYEVDQLLPDIRQSRSVHLHLYAPRVTEAMKSLEDLTFHTIPPVNSTWASPESSLILSLNLWAGQLYLNDYQCYQQLCLLLGLYTTELKDTYPDITVQFDGFIKPEDRKGELRDRCQTISTPLPQLKTLFAYRRKGISFHSTHIGQIFRARLLTEDDFRL